MLNLLTDPIIRLAAGGGGTTVSLPETCAALMRDEVDAFPALRPHQRHAWHAFIVQLGAMALRRAELDEPPTDAKTWRDAIRALTPDFPDDEPWRLVVDDITKPAFMQPPASSDVKWADYKTGRDDRMETPDSLDMLVTSKNHDLKSAVDDSNQSDAWLFAIMTLQTAEGYPGSGNYGISRMNGGLGNRPAFSITPSKRHGPHARRDISALLEYRERLLDEYPMREENGVELLWTRVWDGAKAEAFTLGDMDPFYIEICRRIRLNANRGGDIHAVRATSKGRRIEAEKFNGMVGDPWTPINRKEGKSLTLSKGGFTYKRMVDYLTSGDWQWPPLLEQTESEKRSPQTMTLVARAMVRGQGKTEGYYERAIPLKEKVIRTFGRAGGPEELGDIARERIGEIRIVQGILRHAVSVAAAGGKTSDIGDEHRARANPWANKLDEVVDVVFFDHIQEAFEKTTNAERDKVRDEWLNDVVVKGARGLLDQACDSLPFPAIQRYRARVRARDVFDARLRRDGGWSFLFGKTREEGDKCPSKNPTTQTNLQKETQMRLLK